MKAIEDSNGGLTTVDVAKRAGVSKTTVIKYLSVLKSEGRCEFVEVGPSKLWKARTPHSDAGDEMHMHEGHIYEGHMHEGHIHEGHIHEGTERDPESIQFMSVNKCSFNSEDLTIALALKIKPDQLCAIMKKAKKCVMP